MNAVTTAAVVTATMASNVSYAQPTAPPDVPAAMASSLHYAQSDVMPQLRPALASYLNYAQQASPPTVRTVSPQAGEEASQMISRPKTPAEFARNLKVIFDHDLLLNDDFYIETRLKDIFNLDEVSVINSSDGDENQISIIASVSDSVFPRIKTSKAFGGSTANAHFVGGRTIHQSRLINAGINFGMYEGGPDFDVTQRIFAEKFVRLQPQPSPHARLPTATAPHGNETWKYQQVDDQTEKTITIGFNPAGALDSVLIQINKN